MFCPTGNESGGNTAPGVYLREDPICGTQLENQSELRAPTAERAAYYLDAAIAARTIPGEHIHLDLFFSHEKKCCWCLAAGNRYGHSFPLGTPGMTQCRCLVKTVFVLLAFGEDVQSRDPS